MARMKAKKKVWKAQKLYPHMTIRKINSNLFEAAAFSVYYEGRYEVQAPCPLLAASRLDEELRCHNDWVASGH